VASCSSGRPTATESSTSTATAWGSRRGSARRAAPFCAPETDGILTLYYDTRAAVDEQREALADVATDDPRVNEAYDIYQFFAEDPEGRTLEFQTFLHDLPE
jgi:hypothetical protein